MTDATQRDYGYIDFSAGVILGMISILVYAIRMIPGELRGTLVFLFVIAGVGAANLGMIEVIGSLLKSEEQ